MHLQMAEQIRGALAASNGHAALLPQLEAAWPAFYLGSVAPDINAISPIPREDTHFYAVPPPPAEQAYPTMLARYPQLAAGAALAPDHAHFVAAYGAHLLLDLIWLRQVVLPYFVAPAGLGDRAQRRLTHFILLTYLDTLALAALPAHAESTLAQARPDAWLPFASDDLLGRWRDELAAQLQPGAPVRTIEIYAGRLGIAPAAFAANLRDDAWMQAHVFEKVPVADIQAILQTAVPLSINLIANYLAGERL